MLEMRGCMAKDLLSSIYFYSGLAKVFLRLNKRFIKHKKIIILQYHRITDASDELLALGMGSSYVSPEQFEAQIRYLKNQFSVVSLDWLVNQISENKYKNIPDDSVIVTFDDGYKDNYDNAFPILKKYNVPATIFLVSENIGSDKLMWLHLLYYIAYKIDANNLEKYFSELSGFDFTNLNENQNISHNQRKAILIKRMKFLLNYRIPYKERIVLIRNLVDKLHLNGEEKVAKNLYLSKEQINEMKRYKVDFGAHTKTHPLLSAIPVKDAEEEIVGSKITIEHLIGKKIFSFAYPFGEYYPDIQTKQILEKAGFLCACTTIFGTNRLGKDMFSLKRKGRSYDNIGVFAAEISSIYDLFRSLLKSKDSNPHNSE